LGNITAFNWDIHAIPALPVVHRTWHYLWMIFDSLSWLPRQVPSKPM
jgi:hypothetical protein